MTQYYPKVLSDSYATSLYQTLILNVQWEDGVKTRYGGFTRKAKPINPLDKDLITYIVIQDISKVFEKLGIHQVFLVGVYINYYRDGNDYTPVHSHPNMKQLVLSLGAPRTLTMGNDSYTMENGDVIIFGSQKHGVPKDKSCKEGRISIALFMLDK